MPGSMRDLMRVNTGDPSQRRRGNVLSTADMMGVGRCRNSGGGSYSSRGSPSTSRTGSVPGRNGASVSATAATAAAAAAAVPERQDGEARVDSPQSEAAGKEGAAQEGAGKEATLFSAPEQGPTRFSQKDLDTTVDLRVFMDPAPHTISELAPMSSVYHMFNQMGVRHLPVFDERQQLCGIITRKDMVPELIEAKLYENTEKRQRAARKLQLMRTAAAALKKKSFSARAIHGNMGSNPAVADLDSRRRPSLGCYSNSSAEAAEDARKAEKQRKGSGAGSRFADRFATLTSSRHSAHVPLASLGGRAPFRRSNSAPGRLCRTRSPGRDASTGILRPPGGGATPGKVRRPSPPTRTRSPNPQTTTLTTLTLTTLTLPALTLTGAEGQRLRLRRVGPLLPGGIAVTDAPPPVSHEARAALVGPLAIPDPRSPVQQDLFSARATTLV